MSVAGENAVQMTKCRAGLRGFGKVIPPRSALVFDVELVGLTRGGREEL